MTNTTTTLREFIESLSSVGQDRFVRVINELQRRGSEKEIAALTSRFRAVRAELNDVEERRKKQKAWLSDVKSLREDVEAASNSGDDRSLLQLRVLINELYAEAERDVAESKPLALLAEKAELKQRIQRLEALAELGSSLGSEVKRGN